MNKKQLKKIRRAKLLKKKQTISKNIISLDAKRAYMKERVDFYSAPSDNQEFTDKIVSMNELKVLNQENEDLGYNRGLNWEVFSEEMIKGFKKMDAWVGGDYNTLILKPIMYHEHKDGVPCEQHIRCRIFTDGILDGLYIDLPIERVKNLRTIAKHLEVA